MFSNCVSRLINKFGRNVDIIFSDSNKTSAKAFIQPLKLKDQTYMGGKCIDIGYLNGKNYLYIGDKNCAGSHPCPQWIIIPSHPAA